MLEFDKSVVIDRLPSEVYEMVQSFLVLPPVFVLAPTEPGQICFLG